MKILKRIAVITGIVVIMLLISYLTYTLKMNNGASKTTLFAPNDRIFYKCGVQSVANARVRQRTQFVACDLGGVNARNYNLFALKDCGQRGRASENHEISQAQNSREICELYWGGQINA